MINKIKGLSVLLPVCIILLLKDNVDALPSPTKMQPEEIHQLLIEARNLLSDHVDSSLELGHKALEAATVLQLDSAIANSHHVLGIAHYLLGNYYLFAEHCKQGLATRHAATNPAYASAMYNNKGIAYEMMNLYDEAIKAYNQSMELEKMLGNTYGYYETIINLGKLHEATHMYEKAEEYTLIAMEYFTAIADTFYMGLCYQNLGSIYYTWGDMDKHRDHMERSLELFYALGNRQKIAEVYFNLALNYGAKGSLAEWEHYLEKADSLKGESPFTAASILQQKGALEMLRSNYRTAEDYLIQSIQVFERMDQKDGVVESYLKLIRLYARMQRISDMDSIMHVYTTTVIEMQNESILNRFAELDMQFENSRIRSELEVQYYINQKNQMRIRLLIALFAIVVVASVVISWLYYRLSQTYESLFRLNVVKEPLAVNVERKPEPEMPGDTEIADQVDTEGFPYLTESDEKHKILYNEVLRIVKEDQLFRNPNLTIQDLADLLNTNETHLSQSITLYGGMNFTAFINGLRVEVVKAKLLTPDGRKMPFDEIAAEAGFAHRSDLQSLFKKFTGLTPHQFRQMCE